MDYDNHECTRGITEKAKETEEYKKAYSEELELRKEIWPDINWGYKNEM